MVAVSENTDRIPTNSGCPYHVDHRNRIARSESDIQGLWKAKDAIDQRIDGMKNWVISGMLAVFVNLLVMIFQVFVK